MNHIYNKAAEKGESIISKIKYLISNYQSELPYIISYICVIKRRDQIIYRSINLVNVPYIRFNAAITYPLWSIRCTTMLLRCDKTRVMRLNACFQHTGIQLQTEKVRATIPLARAPERNSTPLHTTPAHIRNSL